MDECARCGRRIVDDKRVKESALMVVIKGLWRQTLEIFLAEIVIATNNKKKKKMSRMLTPRERGLEFAENCPCGSVSPLRTRLRTRTLSMNTRCPVALSPKGLWAVDAIFFRSQRYWCNRCICSPIAAAARVQGMLLNGAPQLVFRIGCPLSLRQ